MKAIGFHSAQPAGRAGALVDCDVAEPVPGPHDLVVRVDAVSVNPVDTKVRRGAVPLEGAGPHVLGYDASGTVVAVGDAVRRFRTGDAVFYAGVLGRAGSNAERQLVDEHIVGPKPARLSHAEAAAMPLTAITAWELLFDRLRVPPRGDIGVEPGTRDAILIVNGAGGVGSILTQIARRLTSLTVIATASRPETIAWCEDMGAHHVIDHREPLDEGLQRIGIPAVRYVAGLTATDAHRDAIVRALAPQGALALIDDPEHFDILPFKLKSLSVHWELMFTRPLFRTPDMERQGRILAEVSALLDDGTLRSTLHDDLGPMNAASLTRAHALVESGRAIGKVVLGGVK